MNKGFWRYYKDIAVINIPLSVTFLLSFGLIWSLIIFCSFGIAMGLLFFRNFKNNEYYLYHNLGFTKGKLIQRVFMINLIIALPLFLIFV